MDIPLAKPQLTEKDRQAVLDVLNTPKLSLGPKLEEFEGLIADYTGVNHAVAVNSGTSALHLIIRSLGIGEGDEVITTPFSFISSSNCILFEGAVPVFVDIDPDTLNIGVEKIEEAITENTKALLAVDVFGQPAEWGKLEEIASEYNLYLIEDSAEALGAEFQGKKAGSFGDAGVFAFYPNKQITTGEGGVIVTNNDDVATLSRSMRNQGRGEGDKWLQHERLGYNYRISDINCALGISQMERIDEIVSRRAEIAESYNQKLQNVSEIQTPLVSPSGKTSWFVYVIRLDDQFTRETRDTILEELSQRGIGCSNYFTPIHLQPFYRKRFGYKPGDFPITEGVSSRTIALPFFNEITEEEMDYVVGHFKEVIREFK